MEELELKREARNHELKSRQKSSGDPKVDKDLWDATVKDLEKGFAAGPFYSENEVGNHLGTGKWFRAPRFPCIQPRPKIITDPET